MASIQLQVSQITFDAENAPGAYQATLSILAVTDIETTKLFVVSQASVSDTPSFLHVAAASDLLELGEAPDFENDELNFRTDAVTVMADDADTIDKFVESCKSRLSALAIALQALEEYSTTEVFTISA